MKPSLCFLHQWTGVVWTGGYRGHQPGHEHGYQHQQPQQSQYGYPQQQREPETAEKTEEPKEEGFMGILRGFYDKMRGKTKGGSDAMVLDDRQIAL